MIIRNSKITKSRMLAVPKKFCIIGMITISIVTTFIYNNSEFYAANISKYEKAMIELGFIGINTANLKVSAAEQHQALLKIFYYSGYFDLDNIWQVINHLEFENPEIIYKIIAKAVNCRKGYFRW